nr:putative late blight resistance protein homolog R1B-8 [Ipomoea trifida]
MVTVASNIVLYVRRDQRSEIRAMTLVLDKVVQDVASKAVNKLVQTVAANIDLVSGIGSAIEDLTSDIETFNARLLDVSKNQNSSDLHVLRVAVKKFRAIVNKAQDAVAKYIALKKRHEDNALAKCFHKIPVPPVVEEGNATGFEDQVKTLEARLTGSSNRIVIPIVGLPGTGKTTFAYQIFHSTNKLNTFVHTMWVHVSQSFDRKQRYIDMLCEITKRPRDEYSGIPEKQLVAGIKDRLKDKKYFIVLDDIWEKNDWDSLNKALPENSQGSRVLVTTRFLNVVDDSDEKPHILEPLDDKFCKTEAAKNDLFHIIDGEQKLNANIVSSHRRLCFHSSSSSTANIFDVEDDPSFLFLNSYNKMKKKNPYPSSEHVHSLLLSSSQKSDIDLKQEELIAFANVFPLLRVLDIESFELSFQLPNELFSLNLLKYLAITTNVNLLPKAFKNLRELQTLVIKTTERTLEINGGIWNMEKLRHVQTNASIQLPSPPQKTWRQNSTGKTNIRSLSSISPTSCTKMIFSKTPHLKKLGVRGNLAELLEEKQEICLFNNLQMLKCLENLKLYGQDESALKVPMLDKFAHRLRKLTFCKTFFKWDEMRILGSLEELEVLKLDENAFRGECWDLKSDVVFNQLQYLRIGRTNLETWMVMENSFPVLENLVLRNCTSLEAIPIAFAKVHSLKVIELYHMTENATNSAKEVVAEQRRDKENIKGLDLKITPFPPKEKVLVVQEDIVVGFKDDVKIIKDRLTGGSFDLTFISIVGAAGFGKSTMAKMVFNDLELHYEFFTRIWVNVSRTFSRRKVFFDIIRQITREIYDRDYSHTSEEVLAENIKMFLEDRKYFIVIDDVWRVEDWDCLKIAFPNNMKGSRVLVTTRHVHLASHADSAINPHCLLPLRNDESWELLEKKVFHKERCPPLLERHGKRIAERCNGSPLGVLTVAGILGKDNSLSEWEQVAKDPLAVINQENRIYQGLVRLSYKKLPSHLKNCFLYLAVFGIGQDIAAWKLIRLWIAEGFISPVEGDESNSSNLELTAQKYLSALADKNLVTVLKRKADGQIKTCRLHDTFHEFCTSEAAKANFFRGIMDGEGAGLDEVNINSHRLCIHSSIFDFLIMIRSERQPSSNKDMCSFLSFCSQRIELPSQALDTFPTAFPLLRVIDLESLTFGSMPTEFFHLNQLRYLAISTHMRFLPEPLDKFEELQTLVFNTTSRSSLQVEANLWSMPKLRHVHTNTPMLLPPPPRNNKKKKNNSEIQTLSTISPSSCTREILGNTPNLQKLGIRGDFVEHMEMMMSNGGTHLFENLRQLKCLENLKLINETAIQHTQFSSFPSADKFPRRLRKMSLRNTRFDWEDMSILGSLDELEVLKLDDEAFLGKVCDVSNIVFKKLQYLRIQKTDLVSWIVSKDSFPVLEYLILKNCTCLHAIPSAFGELESLKVMELFCTNTKAANSARQIHSPNMGATFQLSIYPLDH